MLCIRTVKVDKQNFFKKEKKERERERRKKCRRKMKIVFLQRFPFTTSLIDFFFLKKLFSSEGEKTAGAWGSEGEQCNAGVLLKERTRMPFPIANGDVSQNRKTTPLSSFFFCL